MTTAAYAKCIEALYVRLAATSGIAPIAYENAGYTPTEGVLFIAVNSIPVAIGTDGLGNASKDMHTGIFQVTVNAPKSGRRFDAMAMVEILLARFPRGTTATADSITARVDKVQVAPAVIGAHYSIPVSIYYHTIV